VRIRRRFSSGPNWGRWRTIGSGLLRKLSFANRRFVLVGGAVFLATLGLGWLIAALILFPAPIFATSQGVPRVIGLESEAARSALEDRGLVLANVDRVAHPSLPRDAVVWQDPPPGVVVPEGTQVRLTLSTGPQRIPVPDVTGYASEHATALIEAAGLAVGSVESAQAPTPENVAVNTRPPAGTPLLPGTEVTLVVSVGGATIHIPSLIGLTLDEARIELEEVGLALGADYARTSNAAEPGQVFFQDPAAGTLAAPGTRVNVIIVSRNR
jgi:beta-lactam-binding protein with PASTA domain